MHAFTIQNCASKTKILLYAGNSVSAFVIHERWRSETESKNFVSRVMAL